MITVAVCFFTAGTIRADGPFRDMLRDCWRLMLRAEKKMRKRDSSVAGLYCTVYLQCLEVLPPLSKLLIELIEMIIGKL